jgi:hypothetical protein
VSPVHESRHVFRDAPLVGLLLLVLLVEFPRIRIVTPSTGGSPQVSHQSGRETVSAKAKCFFFIQYRAYFLWYHIRKTGASTERAAKGSSYLCFVAMPGSTPYACTGTKEINFPSPRYCSRCPARDALQRRVGPIDPLILRRTFEQSSHRASVPHPRRDMHAK